MTQTHSSGLLGQTSISAGKGDVHRKRQAHAPHPLLERGSPGQHEILDSRIEASSAPSGH